MYYTMSYIISSLAKHVLHNELNNIISGKTCTTQWVI